MPGYLIGKSLGASQVGAFSIISLFAILNVILLRAIAIKLGANQIASTIASLLFLFGTPAFAYGVNLYQHHVSTFLMLISLYALLRFKNIIALLIVFFAFACAIPLDYPNLFFLLPVAIYAGLQVFSFEEIKERLVFKINTFRLFTPLIMIIPMLFFLWFNNQSYGSPFHLLGGSSVTVAKKIAPDGKPIMANHKKDPTTPSISENNGLRFFETRNLLNGMYIHFISPDRGIIYYSPIILFGLIGLLLTFNKKIKLFPVFFAIIGMNILLYSMWGDPWGGWAFGSRYLIPSYAVLSIFIALLLTYWQKKTWFLLVFMVVGFYSIAVNTLGAVTTSAIPPQVEVLNLEKFSGIVEKFTYERSWDFLIAGKSKSFVWQTFLKDYLSALQFYEVLTISIFIVFSGILLYFSILPNRKGEKNV